MNQLSASNKDNKCAIIVNSCDAFSDVWELFFKALRCQWPDCKFPIYLNTETKQYHKNQGIITINSSSKKKDCWGRRYKEAIKRIETPYIIPFLDDFVLSRRFDGQKTIEDVITWMDKNPDIGVFYLHKHPNVIQSKTEYNGFGIMPQKCDYKLTTAVGLWRKTFLDKCIKGIENPWEWELYATKRSWRYHEKMYALLENENELFEFPFGGVIWRGLWHPVAIELAKEYAVKIDFSRRGFMNADDPYRLKQAYSIHGHFPKGLLTTEFWSQVIKKINGEYRRVRCEK